MFLQPLKVLIKWVLSLGLLSGLLFGLFLARTKMQSDRVGEGGEAKTSSQLQNKEDFVSLEDDEAERYDLKTEIAQPIRWYPRVTVYGRIVPNPQATAEARSPFAGTLQPSPGAPWPVLGQQVKTGQTLGRVDVRVGAEIRLDLENKLADARIKQRGAEEEVKLQQSRADSLKAVTSRQILSRAELDVALIQLAQAKNQLATAKAAAELWQKALREIERHKGDERSRWSEPLVAPIDGEVTDLTGRPGMSVEAGALVLTLVDFRRPLIRLDIPAELLVLGGPPPQVEIQAPAASLPPSLGDTLNPSQATKSSPKVEAHLVGPAPRVDVTSQFVSYWYEALLSPKDNATGTVGGENGTSRVLWRQGMQVMAEIRAEGAASQSAVGVPAKAVLFHEGRPLVYVRTGPEKYQRREVHLLGREGDSWVLSARQGDLPVGVTAGEAVVTRAAQVLLSKEFLSGAPDND